jgi:predicted esterase
MRFTKDERRKGYVLNPTSKHSHTFIYLHGFGESMEGKYKGYEDAFYFQNRTPFPGLRVICLEAPKLPITCFNGGKTAAWYDYLTNHEGEREDLVNMKTLKKTMKRVHTVVRQEAKKVGSQNVFLGGISQGAGTALHCAATLPEPLTIGGFFGMLGHVLTDTPVDGLAGESRTPICLGPMMFFNHESDDIMRLPWVGETYTRLAAAKVPRVSLFIKEGVHDYSDEEQVYIAEFLSAVLPPPPLPDLISELYGIDCIAAEPTQKALPVAKTKPKTGTKKDTAQKTILKRQTSTSSTKSLKRQTSTSSTKKGRR